jgi:hypothetical protein
MALLRRTLEHVTACISANNAHLLFLPGKTKRVASESLSVLIHYYNTKYYSQPCPVESHTTNDPLLPPYAKHVEVARLADGADHYVFVNIGQVVRGHVVVSSANPKAIQGDDLDISDCHALAQVVTGFDQRGLAYYNAGVESGCSQMHKHMQFAPVLDNPLFDVMRAGERLPWRYFKAELADITPNVIR